MNGSCLDWSLFARSCRRTAPRHVCQEERDFSCVCANNYSWIAPRRCAKSCSRLFKTPACSRQRHRGLRRGDSAGAPSPPIVQAGSRRYERGPSSTRLPLKVRPCEDQRYRRMSMIMIQFQCVLLPFASWLQPCRNGCFPRIFAGRYFLPRWPSEVRVVTAPRSSVWKTAGGVMINQIKRFVVGSPRSWWMHCLAT